MLKIVILHVSRAMHNWGKGNWGGGGGGGGAHACVSLFQTETDKQQGEYITNSIQ